VSPYDAWKTLSPEDAGFYRFERDRPRRKLACIGCGEDCDGLLCEDCAEEREEER
jgi:hypothetical protein